MFIAVLLRIILNASIISKTILLLLSTDPPNTTFTAHGHVFMAPTAEGKEE